MKKLNTKFWLIRPADALLPLALTAASALGRSDMADRLFHYLLLSRLFGLASAVGIRQAFARQPSMRKATGSVRIALLLQIIGGALIFLIEMVVNGGRMAPAARVALMTGTLLNVEQVFYEYLEAAGEGHSALMTHAVTDILSFGGLMMTSATSGGGVLPYGMEWLLGAAAVSAALSGFIGMTIGGKLTGRMNSEVITCAPFAIAACAAYPLAWLVLNRIPGFPMTVTSIPFFTGLTLFELWRTPFRRNRLEDRPMNKALMIVCVVAVIMWFVPVDFHTGAKKATAAALLAASGCLWGLYGNFKREQE